MKKSCDKTVSGEALSQKRFEEEIRKHAFWYPICENKDECDQWESSKLMVELDVVLCVVAKTEAEHRESLKKIAKLFDNEELDQLYALEQENREVNNDLAGYKTAEAERTKKTPRHS